MKNKTFNYRKTSKDCAKYVLYFIFSAVAFVVGAGVYSYLVQ